MAPCLSSRAQRLLDMVPICRLLQQCTPGMQRGLQAISCSSSVGSPAHKVLSATWAPPAGSGLHGRCQVATFWIVTLLEFAPGGDTPVHKVPISAEAHVSTLLAEFSSREACS